MLAAVIGWSALMALIKMAAPEPARLSTLSFEGLDLSVSAQAFSEDDIGRSSSSAVFMTPPDRVPSFISRALVPALERIEVTGLRNLELTACMGSDADCVVDTQGTTVVSVATEHDVPLEVRKLSPLVSTAGKPCTAGFLLSVTPKRFELRSAAGAGEACAGELDLSLGPGPKRLVVSGPRKVPPPSSPTGPLRLKAEWQSEGVLSAEFRASDSREPFYRAFRFSKLEGLLAAPFDASATRFKRCRAEAGSRLQFGQPGSFHRLWRDGERGALAGTIDAPSGGVKECSPDGAHCIDACRFPTSEFVVEFFTWAMGGIGLLIALFGWLTPSEGICDREKARHRA